MSTRRSSSGYARILALGSLFFVFGALQAAAQGPGGPNGVDIMIRAENRVTTDVPFCGIGGGTVGDKLAVDAFMDTNGVVTGTARFEPANGAVTLLDLDRMFAFTVCGGGFSGLCGGVLVQETNGGTINGGTIPIWINDFLIASGNARSFVNVEIPNRGCGNNKSTFTPGLDKVTMQIKFR